MLVKAWMIVIEMVVVVVVMMMMMATTTTTIVIKKKKKKKKMTTMMMENVGLQMRGNSRSNKDSEDSAIWGSGRDSPEKVCMNDSVMSTEATSAEFAH
eukprot:237625-Hanusia_phi.AAC.2